MWGEFFPLVEWMAVERETVPEMTQRGAARVGSAPAPVWLQRVSLVVLVLFCFYIGGLLALLPWSPRYWSENGWVMSHPMVDAVVQQGWLRGLVSGLGLIDIWIGVSELLHYRDYRG